MLGTMQRNTLIAAYMACLTIMVTIGMAYGVLSPGLAAPGGDGPFFCRNLLSSGGDDDAMMLAFALFALPLALRLVRLNRRIAGYEVLLFWICFAASGAALLLASLDCASIFYTAFVVPDVVLAAALVALPGSAVLLTRLRSIGASQGLYSSGA